jgi:hypothetical protein
MNGESSVQPLPAVARHYIDELVGNMRCRRGLREEVRQELEAHFEDALRHYATEEARAASAEAQIAEFGDGALLAELLQRGKRRCDPGMMPRILGMMGVAGILLLAMNLGGPILLFINFPALMLVTLVPLALGTATYGPRPLAAAFRALLGLVYPVDPDVITPHTTTILRSLIVYTYGATAVYTQLSLIQVLDPDADLSRWGMALAILLLSLLYCVLLTEGIYRPASVRAAFLHELNLIQQPGAASSGMAKGERG